MPLSPSETAFFVKISIRRLRGFVSTPVLQSNTRDVAVQTLVCWQLSRPKLATTSFTRFSRCSSDISGPYSLHANIRFSRTARRTSSFAGERGNTAFKSVITLCLGRGNPLTFEDTSYSANEKFSTLSLRT